MGDYSYSARFRTFGLAPIATIAFGAWLCACYDARIDESKRPQGDEACAGTCHGNGTRTFPPQDIDGKSSTSEKGVGAHEAHMLASETHRAMECAACHIVPKTTADKGHADDPRPAELVFSGTAILQDRVPSYDPATSRCADTYCHNGPKGNWAGTNDWTSPRASKDACGSSCHTLPPPAPHTQSTACEGCHTKTAGPNLTIKDPSFHINGDPDVVGGSCSSCHGSDKNNAPPLDTSGKSDTTLASVGAHQTHLSGGKFSAKVECSACHIVPQTNGDIGHTDTALPAELSFSGTANAKGAQGSWSHDTTTCSGTWCHGSKLIGGSNSTPNWVKVDGSQTGCGSCHSLPPPAPHIQSDACESCHTETVGPGLAIINPAKHINGTIEVTTSCSSCHGSDTNNAPPLDTSGKSDTTSASVGAHQTHLNGGKLGAKVECSACHLVPQTVDDKGHNDTALPAELTFSGTANAGSAQSVWDHDTTTCSGTWCHGAKLKGGTNTTPNWVKVDGSQAVCGSCHSLPPPAPHVQFSLCVACHGDTVGPGPTIINPANHINGVVNIKGQSCHSCHGSATNDAPPTDTKGSALTTDISVGAHQAHLSGGLFSKAMECGVCHVVPASINAPGHIDTTPAEVSFSGLSIQNGSNPVWDRNAITCTGSYCHGSAAWGGNKHVPIWNKVDGSQATCGGCHSLPPPAPHPSSSSCELCHAETINASMDIIAKSKHVDGTVQVDMSKACSACHGDATSNAPPKDSKGNTATTFPGVGAHRRHLDAALMQYTNPIACGTCHTLPPPSSTHMNGQSNLVFTGISGGSTDGTTHKSTPGYSATTFTCAGVYCHGAWTEVSAPSGATFPLPIWNKVDNTQVVCGGCHGLPPPAPHPQDANCRKCHPSVVDVNKKIIDRGLHINGNIDY